MSEYADAGEWANTLQIINELWPTGGKFQDGLNAHQMKEWQARLRGRNQLLVRAAARNVFAEKAGPRPRLAWILKELRALEQNQRSGENKERDEQKSEYDAIWAENVRNADRLRPILAALPAAELLHYKRKAMKAFAMSRGITTPPGDTAARVASIGFIKQTTEGVSDDPEKWNPTLVNMVESCRELESRGIWVMGEDVYKPTCPDCGRELSDDGECTNYDCETALDAFADAIEEGE